MRSSTPKSAREWLRFIWNGEGVLGWVINIILAFIIIKYLLYPGLGLILGTPVPIVAVVSGSMEHEGNLDEYWTNPICCGMKCTVRSVPGSYYEQINITSEDFRRFDFVNGFDKGDIMILAKPNPIEKGDVIVYMANRPDPIIHRVISHAFKNGKVFYTTKGDNNCESGDFETRIAEEQILGKAVWRIPYLGWVKIAAVELLEALR